MAKIPNLISSELVMSILFVPQCVRTVLTNFGSFILLTHHKTFSSRSLPIPSLIVLYRKNKILKDLMANHHHGRMVFS